MSIPTLIAVSAILSFSFAQQLIPAAFPPSDQSKNIPDSFLSDPCITAALDIVNSKVPKNLLDIPPSTYVSLSTVTYNSDAVANCYWPVNQCLRTADNDVYFADINTCKGSGKWGLSYDDGPSRNIVNNAHVSDTYELLQSLRVRNLRATFFVIGGNAVQYQDELIELDKAGNQIAVHTWTHHPLTSLSNAQVVAEIKYTEAIIFKAINKKPAYLRPPYGDFDDRIRAIAAALGYKIAVWTRDSGDSSADTSNTATLIRSWFNSTESFVSLQHDSSQTSVKIAISTLEKWETKLKVGPIAECNDDPFYENEGPPGKKKPTDEPGTGRIIPPPSYYSNPAKKDKSKSHDDHSSPDDCSKKKDGKIVSKSYKKRRVSFALIVMGITCLIYVM